MGNTNSQRLYLRPSLERAADIRHRPRGGVRPEERESSRQGVAGVKVRRDGNGVHIFNRRSGLNVLLDEIEVPLHERAWAPRFVAVALTNACDLHCRFCYAPKHVARLDVDAVVAWSIELDGGGCMGIGFGGGEPTLHPHFAHLCQRIARETQLAVSFTTHAHRITEELVEQVKGAVHFVRVSMDGIGETYERIRGRNFATFLDKLRLVRAIAPFGVNYVVNAETVRDRYRRDTSSGESPGRSGLVPNGDMGDPSTLRPEQ